MVYQDSLLSNQIILGCLDEAACNYDINANTEDNSCIYPLEKLAATFLM